MLSRVTPNTVYRAVSQTTKINQKLIQNHRFLHSTCCTKKLFLRNNSSKRIHQYPRKFDISFNRYASTQIGNGTEVPSPSVDSSIDPLDQIPDPPPLQPLDEMLNVVAKFHENGEPTLQSLGLARFTPPGFLQSGLEWLHINLDMPWWAAITTGVVLARIIVFPLMIYSQKKNAAMIQNTPKMDAINFKLSEAKKSGDVYEVAKCSIEMREFMKTNNLNPLKGLTTLVVQGPIFCSFFLGLRAMANAPVPSFVNGGLWWFTDLTLSDPYCALPLLTCATLALTIELGVEGVNPQSLGLMRYVMRAFPIIMFPLMYNWHGAILWYWFSNNTISLFQVGILKIPKVRKVLKLPPKPTFDRSKLIMKPKPFIPAIKESWQNLKLSKQLSDRQRADELQFANAGRGTTIKTYKYDPTKPIPKIQMASKKR